MRSAVVTAILIILGPATAAGAQLDVPTAPVMTVPTFITDPDDVVAVDLNPAALGFLPAWAGRYSHVEAPDASQVLNAGDAFYLGGPLFFGLAAGISVESLRPTQATGEPDRGRFSLDLAFAPTSTLAMGAAVRWLGSGDPSVHGLTTFDLALAFRPSPTLAFTILGSDLNGPFDLAGGGRQIDAAFTFASALRPWGTDVLGLEGAAVASTDGRVALRAALAARVPYVGRLQAVGTWNDVGSNDKDFRFVTGLAADWGGASVTGGVVTGDAFDEKAGWYVSAALSAAKRDGIPQRRYVLDVHLQSAVGPRRILRVLALLDRARSDDRIAGVLLRVSDSQIGSAYAQELRLALVELERVDKKVHCHLDAASAPELYACAIASSISMDPAGGVRLVGPAVTVLSLRDVMAKIGLRAEFVRIGEYKSFVEQFTRSRMSEPAREQREALLDDFYQRWTTDLASDYERTPAWVRARMDQGPYIASEAEQVALVQSLADESDLPERLRDLNGRSYPVRENLSHDAPRAWGRPRGIGVVVVDGNIVDGENVDVPFVGIHLSGGRTVSEAIDQLAADPSVAVIVLRVDSPGGSVMASDQIWRALRRARERKPVIASMGAVAASGGYYIASAAQEIWANPSTVTGSIGVLFGKVDAQILADKIGLGVEQLSRGRRAGLESWWRPFTPDERSMLADKVRLWYQMFLRRVHEGRGMPVARVDALGRGRVWSGDAAFERGLVDRLGGYAAALARARELARLPVDADIRLLPFRPSKLLDYVWRERNRDAGARSAAAGGLVAAGSKEHVVVPPEVSAVLNAAAAVAGTRVGLPMAISPVLILE